MQNYSYEIGVKVERFLETLEFFNSEVITHTGKCISSLLIENEEYIFYLYREK